MNDRDQASYELATIVAQFFAADDTPEDAVNALLAHPDLVLRALGMEPCGWKQARRVWVEPPTDQGEPS